MIRLRLGSQRARLILIAALAVVPALGVTVWNGLAQRAEARRDVEAEAMRWARLAAAEQARLIEGARQLLQVLAEVPEVRGGPGAGCNEFLADLRTHYPLYGNFGVIAPDGSVLCSALPAAPGLNLADREYFQRTMQTGGFGVGDYQIGRITGRAGINFGFPVRSKEGKIVAVVFAALDLAWLKNYAAEIDLPPQGYVLLVVDRKGTVLARVPDPGGWVGRNAQNADLMRAILARTVGGMASSVDERGAEWLYAFTPLGANQGDNDHAVWVSVGIPADPAFAPVRRLLWRSALVLAAVALLALALAWAAGNFFMVRPVERLLDASRRLEQGDRAARHAPPYPGGEIGELARGFDDMAAAIERHESELLAAYDQTLEGWAKALELRDRETEGHTQRVTQLAVRLARTMGVEGPALDQLRRGALLHDIGKIGIPDSILQKPGPLTDAERREMERHTTHAWQMLQHIPFLEPALDIPYCHHEKWDGSGYPRGLRGEDIPLPARIFAVVDVWDALVSGRPYREPWDRPRVREYLRTLAGSHLDPACVETFLRMELRGEI